MTGTCTGPLLEEHDARDNECQQRRGRRIAAKCQPAGAYRLVKEIAHNCIDPAESAQVRLLKRMPQQVFSCPVPDAGAGCYRSRSSRQ